MKQIMSVLVVAGFMTVSVLAFGQARIKVNPNINLGPDPTADQIADALAQCEALIGPDFRKLINGGVGCGVFEVNGDIVVHPGDFPLRDKV